MFRYIYIHTHARTRAHTYTRVSGNAYIKLWSWSFVTLRFYANWERTAVFSIYVPILYKRKAKLEI